MCCSKLIFRGFADGFRIWPEANENLDALTVTVKGQPYNHIRQVLPDLGEKGVDFLDGLLAYDPQRRFTATEALQHEYFKESPRPKPVHRMPVFSPAHEGK